MDWTIIDFTYHKGAITGKVLMTDDLPYFQGHFPGAPLLPGVAQLRLIISMIEKAIELPVKLQAMPRIKFTTKVAPGAVLSFRIEISIEDGRASWRLFEGKHDVSTGNLLFTVSQ